MGYSHGVLRKGSDALKELAENYTTMDLQAFCAKWGLSPTTVRSAASRMGFARSRPKKAKIDTANTHNDTSTKREETVLASPYSPPKAMISPAVLKTRPGRYLKTRRDATSRAELNTMPVPFPFSEFTEAPYNRHRAVDKTPEEAGRVMSHSKNR